MAMHQMGVRENSHTSPQHPLSCDSLSREAMPYDCHGQDAYKTCKRKNAAQKTRAQQFVHLCCALSLYFPVYCMLYGPYNPLESFTCACATCLT